GSAAVLRGPGEGMEPVEGLRALHRRRGKDGHDQQGDVQPLLAGAPQCRGDRCGPGRSELRGDRRGGEPATRPESADAEAAGGCGSFNIETTPINRGTITPLIKPPAAREWIKLIVTSIAAPVAGFPWGNSPR